MNFSHFYRRIGEDSRAEYLQTGGESADYIGDIFERLARRYRLKYPWAENLKAFQ